MKTSFKNSLLAVAGIFAAIALVSEVANLADNSAQAQGYFTNANGPYFGAAQYNSSIPNPVLPSQTIQRQYNAGINAGTATTIGATGLITNSFATNYVYSAAPSVVVTQNGATQTGTNLVTSITLTNFIYQSGASGTVVSWIAVGH